MKEHEFFEGLMVDTSSNISINSTPNQIHIGNINLEDLIKDEIKNYDNNRIFSDEVLAELLADNLKDLKNKLTKELEEELAREKRKDIDRFIAKIDKVYFGKGTTVIKWKDGTSTKVKCQDGETFDKEKGVAMCIIKHMFGDIGYYNEIFKSLNLDEDVAETKPEIKESKPKKRFFTFGDIFGF
jgi:hypothetical protein